MKDIVKPYVILEKYGLKIGVFGLGAEPEGLIQANKCEGIVYEDPVGVSNEVAALLKEKDVMLWYVCRIWEFRWTNAWWRIHVISM